MPDAASPPRSDLVRHGKRLEYFTVAWNSTEALVSIVAGLIAGSVSLVGFGLDSIIEMVSGAALLWRLHHWRLHHDLDRSRREQVERTTLRIVGWCFTALALYILYESGSTLIGHKAPERSLPGIIVAAVSLVVMPLLARAKRLGCCRNRKRSHERRFQCVVGLVVGRSGGRDRDGADHCEGRHRRTSGQGVLR